MKILKNILRAHLGLTVLFVMLGLISSFLNTLGAGLLQRVLDGFAGGSLTLGAVLFYGGVLGLVILLQYLDNAPDVRLPGMIYLDLKTLALQKMSTIDYRTYQRLGAGALIQRIENGAAAGRDLLVQFYLALISWYVPDIVFSLLFIWSFDPGIMWYIALGYGVVFLVSRLLLKVLYKYKQRLLDHEELLGHVLVRGLTELVVFRTHRRYGAEVDRVRASAREITDAKVAIRMVHEAFFTLFALLVVVIKVFLIWASYRAGGLTVGGLAALLLLIDRAYTPIAIVNVTYVDYKLNRTAFARLEDFLQAPDDPRLIAGEAPGTLKGSFSLSNIRVDYEGRQALGDLSLRIEAGTTVALVGESGAGKSTAAKLMAGLLLPDQGRVSVDRQDLARMDLDAYYAQIAYTGQEAPVFAGTLRENLAFDRDIPDEDLREALEAAELGSLLARLPEGLQTQVGERGILLSGGERQRLALARLFLMPAPIVILDEATSALDSLTERRVMERLLPRLRGRTVIIIAHRLTSLTGVDRLFVLREGRCVEEGTFEALLEAGGLFAALWHRREETGDQIEED